MSRKKKSTHSHHCLQKLIVAIIAIVIIIIIAKVYVVTPLRERATDKMAEKLIQSEIAKDTSLPEGVQAQEILDSMSEEDRTEIQQIVEANMSPETFAKASSYLAAGDTEGLKEYAKATLSEEELQQIKDLYVKYKDQLVLQNTEE